jgi:hypothetical protein
MFNYNDYNNKFNIFKKNIKVIDRYYYYTSLYKISNINYKLYKNIINDIYDNELCYSDLEVILPEKLKYNFKTVDNLGITQFISVWKEISDI